jgi:hypothetical protein
LARDSDHRAKLTLISDPHYHYGTARIAQNVLDGQRAWHFPYASPREDDKVRGLLLGQAQDFLRGVAVREEHPHVQLAEWANA